MQVNLNRRKKAGLIDFIQVPLYRGYKYSEFLGYDLKGQYFFTLFNNGKYREDDYGTERVETELKRLNKTLEQYESCKDLNSIFSTEKEYQEVKKQIDFINKYNK